MEGDTSNRATSTLPRYAVLKLPNGVNPNAIDRGVPAVDELAHRPDHSAETTITNASLIELNRDNKMYERTEIATAHLTLR